MMFGTITIEKDEVQELIKGFLQSKLGITNFEDFHIRVDGHNYQSYDLSELDITLEKKVKKND